jgi:hypothetical protein
VETYLVMSQQEPPASFRVHNFLCNLLQNFALERPE